MIVMVTITTTSTLLSFITSLSATGPRTTPRDVAPAVKGGRRGRGFGGEAPDTLVLFVNVCG